MVDTLFATLHSTDKAKFITRVVQFDSEPLFGGLSLRSRYGMRETS